MEEQHSFDEFFRESLADYRETPPPAAWDMVVQRLDDDDRRRRRGFFYWPWTVLSILLLIGGAWWLYGWNNNRTLRPALNGAGRTEQPDRQPAAPAVATSTNANRSQSETRSSAETDRYPATAGRVTGSSANPLVPATVPLPRIAQHPGSAATRQHGSPIHAMQPMSQQTGTPGPLAAAHGSRSAKRAGASSGFVPTPVGQQASGPGVFSKETLLAPQAALPAQQASVANGASSVKPAAVAPVPAVSPAAAGVNPLAAAVRAAIAVQSPAAEPFDKLDTKAGSTHPEAGGTIPAGAGTQAAASASNSELTPNLAATVTAPVLLASLDPVLHLFAGAPMPPVLSLYETGLLEPAVYQAPAAAASAGAPAGMAAAAPAMYPPDSNMKSAGSIMSLSGFFGYERGIKTPPRNMFTVGISLMWQLSQKFAVGTKPALLYGSMPRTGLTTDKAYQRSAVDVTRFTTRDYSPSILGQVDTVNNYVIREAFDSIVVRGTYLKGNMWQLELPLILQFNPFGSAFRLYGGPSVYLGGGMKIRSEGPESIYTIDRKDSIVQSVRMSEEQIRNYFGKSNLESYNTYNPDLHSFNNLDPVRFGYQFGVGYQRNRMNFDISVRQQLTGYHQLSDRLQQLYSLPTFRLSFGYTLIPVKPASAKPIPYAN